ncbi:MAG: tRNA 2-thiocytidine(32) synthetase TtcA [Deltaproteobacteria bacterium]|nr:tRNA 2-thiocytidine(32) synthetase TtcA [Deltaproteobacteria bacterium]
MENVAALEKKLLHDVGRAIADFALIDDGDQILVGMSGGKDSYVLFHLLRLLQKRAPVRFELVAFHLDQGHPNFPVHTIESYLKSEGVAYRIERVDTYSIVKEKIPEGDMTCSLCSRLRRGIIYNWAPKYGCNKIALGHHQDDAIETVLLNMFFNGRIRGMAARLVSEDQRNVVIRPLIYAPEDRIAAYARAKGFPVVPCVLCSEQEGAERAILKELLTSLEARSPGVKSRMGAALGNVELASLLDVRFAGHGSERTDANDSDTDVGLPRVPRAGVATRLPIL